MLGVREAKTPAIILKNSITFGRPDDRGSFPWVEPRKALQPSDGVGMTLTEPGRCAYSLYESCFATHLESIHICRRTCKRGKRWKNPLTKG